MIPFKCRYGAGCWWRVGYLKLILCDTSGSSTERLVRFPSRGHADSSYRIPKLSSFYRNEPKLWFAQAGAVMAALDRDFV